MRGEPSPGSEWLSQRGSCPSSGSSAGSPRGWGSLGQPESLEKGREGDSRSAPEAGMRGLLGKKRSVLWERAREREESRAEASCLGLQPLVLLSHWWYGHCSLVCVQVLEKSIPGLGRCDEITVLPSHFPSPWTSALTVDCMVCWLSCNTGAVGQLGKCLLLALQIRKQIHRVRNSASCQSVISQLVQNLIVVILWQCTQIYLSQQYIWQRTGVQSSRQKDFVCSLFILGFVVYFQQNFSVSQMTFVN